MENNTQREISSQKSKMAYLVILAALIILLAFISVLFLSVHLPFVAILIHILFPVAVISLYKSSKKRGVPLKAPDAFIAGTIVLILAWIAILLIGDIFGGGLVGSSTHLALMASLFYTAIISIIAAITIAILDSRSNRNFL